MCYFYIFDNISVYLKKKGGDNVSEKIGEEKCKILLFKDPRSWKGKDSEKWGPGHEMLAFKYLDLSNSSVGEFSVQDDPDRLDEFGLSEIILNNNYSDFSKSPVKIFTLVLEITKAGFNNYAKPVRVLDEKLTLSIK